MVFSQQILVRMHPPLRDAVRAAAERAGLSMSELVRRTLHREIADPIAKDMPSSTAVMPGSAHVQSGSSAGHLQENCRGA